MSNASSHDPYNLPVLLAGGGFKHGEHLAFRPKSNVPLCNLYLSILHGLGIEAKAFGSSSGSLKGLGCGDRASTEPDASGLGDGLQSLFLREGRSMAWDDSHCYSMAVNRLIGDMTLDVGR